MIWGLAKRSLVKALVKGMFDLINPLTIADGLPDVNSDPSYRRSVGLLAAMEGQLKEISDRR